MKKNMVKNIQGFTLIEFLIYIGITSIVVVALTTFGGLFMRDSVKISQIREVNNNGNFVLQSLSYFVKRASSINVNTIYVSNPGTLILNFADGSTVTIDTYQKTIRTAQKDTIIRKLRFTRDNVISDMTGDNVDVENFIVVNRSKSAATTVEIQLNLSSFNPENDIFYASENSWTTSFTLRKP